MDFLDYVREHSQEIIEETKALLRIPSVLDKYDPKSDKPFGEGIYEALMHVLNRAKTDGFITKNIRNYAAHIEYGEGEELLGILCHLDVVPPGDYWSHPPFQPIVKDGKLYARGSNDDKGPTMAAYFALKFLKDLDVNLTKRVRIILGTDEETAWRGIQEYFKTEEMPTIGFAPDASFPLIYGEKGIWTFDIEGIPSKESPLKTFKSGERYNVVPDYAECTLDINLQEAFSTFLKYHGFKGEYVEGKYIVHGKNAHAMQPYLGVNAAFILSRFLSEHIRDPFIDFIQQYLSFDCFGEKLKLDYKDKEMGDFTINAGIFEYAEGIAKIGVNCRYPNGFDLTKGQANVEQAAKKLGLTYQFKGDIPIHYVKPDDALIKTLMNAYQKITNDYESKPYTIGGGTYARALDKAVAFGMTMPGRSDVAHQADEHIFIEDLIEATAIYMEAIYALCHD